MSKEPRLAREWLLSRHAEESSALDRLRVRTLADLPNEIERVSTTRSLVHALFYPNRFAWSAIAAAWIALVVFHFTTNHVARQPVAPKIPPATIAAWLTELKSHDVFAQTNHLD